MCWHQLFLVDSSFLLGLRRCNDGNQNGYICYVSYARNNNRKHCPSGSATQLHTFVHVQVPIVYAHNSWPDLLHNNLINELATCCRLYRTGVSNVQPQPDLHSSCNKRVQLHCTCTAAAIIAHCCSHACRAAVIVTCTCTLVHSNCTVKGT